VWPSRPTARVFWQCSGPGDTRVSPGRTGRGERRYGRRRIDAEESQPPFVRLMMDELSEADRATAWAEIKEALRPVEGPGGFVAPSEALMATRVA